MNTDLFLLVGRKSLKLLYCQNKLDIREYEHENNAHIPFCFYADHKNDVLLGERALAKYKNNDSNSHYDYFELIKKVNQVFLFHGDSQRIGNIIVRATEYLIAEFFKNVLFTGDNIYDLKDKLKLNLIFSNDVSENEITYVNAIFKKEGFFKIKSFYYNYIFLNYLDSFRKIGSYKGYIVADSIDSNLHLNYFDSLKRKLYKDIEIGEGLAIDPNLKLLGEHIINIAIEKTGSLVNPKDELKLHSEVFEKAYDLFNHKSEFAIELTLSDGTKSRVKIKRRIISDKLTRSNEFSKDASFLEHFYDQTGIQQSDMIIILHMDIHSENFINKIKSKYTNVYQSKDLITEIFQLFYKNSNCIENGVLSKDVDQELEIITKLDENVPKLKPTTQSNSSDFSESQPTNNSSTKPTKEEKKPTKEEKKPTKVTVPKIPSQPSVVAQKKKSTKKIPQPPPPPPSPVGKTIGKNKSKNAKTTIPGVSSKRKSFSIPPPPKAPLKNKPKKTSIKRPIAPPPIPKKNNK